MFGFVLLHSQKVFQIHLYRSFSANFIPHEFQSMTHTACYATHLYGYTQYKIGMLILQQRKLKLRAEITPQLSLHLTNITQVTKFRKS